MNDRDDDENGRGMMVVKMMVMAPPHAMHMLQWFMMVMEMNSDGSDDDGDDPPHEWNRLQPLANTSCAPEHEPRALAAEQERGSAVLLGGAAELAGQPQPRQRCLAAVGFELKPPHPGAPVHSGA